MRKVERDHSKNDRIRWKIFKVEREKGKKDRQTERERDPQGSGVKPALAKDGGDKGAQEPLVNVIIDAATVNGLRQQSTQSLPGNLFWGNMRAVFILSEKLN